MRFLTKQQVNSVPRFPSQIAGPLELKLVSRPHATLHVWCLATLGNTLYTSLVPYACSNSVSHAVSGPCKPTINNSYDIFFAVLDDNG